MLRSTIVRLTHGRGERTDGDDKVVEIEEVYSKGGSQVFVEGKVGGIKERLSHGMKNFLHH